MNLRWITSAPLLCRRFLLLSPSKKIVLLQTLLIVVVMRVSLAFYSLQQILRMLKQRAHRTPSRHRSSLEDIVYAATVINRRLSLATCLVTGLAGHYLLTRNGFCPTLHIGVKKETDRVLAAHAWVTIDTQVVIGKIDDLDTYTPLPGIG